MGRLSHFDEDEDQAEVSMSPLIDAVFLLLIFFLVSTIVKKQNKDIDIDLPVSESAEKRLPTDDQAVIGIDADGNIFFQGVESTVMDLHRELRGIAITDPDLQIRIDTDAEAPLHAVIEVVDLCQFNDLSDVVLRTYDEHYNRR